MACEWRRPCGTFPPYVEVAETGHDKIAPALSKLIAQRRKRARAALARGQRRFPARARDAGKRLADGLLDLAHVNGVRGLGLLLAAELSDRDAREVATAALAAGLVVNVVSPTALRFAPSLLVDDAEIGEALSILEGILV